jgi:hypothetical protein
MGVKDSALSLGRVNFNADPRDWGGQLVEIISDLTRRVNELELNKKTVDGKFSRHDNSITNLSKKVQELDA